MWVVRVTVFHRRKFWEIGSQRTLKHYITKLYLNLSVCEIGLSVGLEFQNLRSFWIYPALSSCDWELKSVLTWLIYLFSSESFWVELETSFLDSTTCLVPSLQSHGVVPNYAQGKQGGKKKGKFWFLFSSEKWNICVWWWGSRNVGRDRWGPLSTVCVQGRRCEQLHSYQLLSVICNISILFNPCVRKSCAVHASICSC